MMASNIRLSAGVSTTTNLLAPITIKRAAPSWGMDTKSISLPGIGQNLIQSDPMLDSVTKCLEAEIGIVVEVVDNLRVEPATG